MPPRPSDEAQGGGEGQGGGSDAGRAGGGRAGAAGGLDEEEEEEGAQIFLSSLLIMIRPPQENWTLFYELFSWHFLFGVCVLPEECKNCWLFWVSTSGFGSLFCALLGST